MIQQKGEYNNSTLTHDEVLELIARSQNGDKEAEDTLVKRNIALVKSVVKKFLNRGYEYEDLFQIGSVGLIKAIHNYKSEYNVHFSTYAVPMIMGEIKRFIRDDGPIKVSRSLKEISGKAVSVSDFLRKKYHREPTIKEISDVMGVPAEEIVFAMESSRAPESIYEVIHEDDDSPLLLIDRMAEKDEGDKIIDKIMLRELLSQLSKKERQIIILRYFQDKTQSEIADMMGVSQVQISRLETKILQKMRNSVR